MTNEEQIIKITLEETILFLKEKAPNTTLTARAIINQQILEKLYG